MSPGSRSFSQRSLDFALQILSRKSNCFLLVSYQGHSCFKYSDILTFVYREYNERWISRDRNYFLSWLQTNL